MTHLYTKVIRDPVFRNVMWYLMMLACAAMAIGTLSLYEIPVQYLICALLFSIEIGIWRVYSALKKPYKQGTITK